MTLHIRTGSYGDWIALYRDGVKISEGHSLDASDVLDALGLAYTSEEIEQDDIGNAADGSDPFPDRL